MQKVLLFPTPILKLMGPVGFSDCNGFLHLRPSLAWVMQIAQTRGDYYPFSILSLSSQIVSLLLVSLKC